MNSLKTLLISSVLLMFSTLVCADSKASLPVYNNTIANISLGYEGSTLAGDLTLNNGFIFHIHDYAERDDNVMKTWGKNDPIYFTSTVHNDMLVLTIKRVDREDANRVVAYAVFDVVNSPKSGLKITEINDHGQYVKLNDGSVWDFSWFNRLSTKYWKVGERVLVYGAGKTDCYEFINLDTHIHTHSSSANASFVVH